jgi:UDP-glucose 4-epimerase
MMMIREILHNKIELSFTSSQNDYHYEITPYNFSPKLAKKIISDYYIDLGQGILDMLNRIHKEDCLS